MGGGGVWVSSRTLGTTTQVWS